MVKKANGAKQAAAGNGKTVANTASKKRKLVAEKVAKSSKKAKVAQVKFRVFFDAFFKLTFVFDEMNMVPFWHAGIGRIFRL